MAGSRDKRRLPARAGPLTAAYQNLPEENYSDRWRMASTLAALEQDSAREALQQIARQEIPEEAFPESHGLGSVGEERLIRVAATDGLAALAKKGNAQAEAALLEMAEEQDDVTLQRRAIRGFLAAGDDFQARADLLKSKIPPRHHALITLTVTSLAEVPQLNPEAGETVGRRNRPKALDRGSWAAAWPRLLPEARAESCEFKRFSGPDYESFYSPKAWCTDGKIARLWSDFKMESQVWDGAGGYSEPCNMKTPLARTLNSLWVLLTSDPQALNDLSDRKGSILRWAYGYAAMASDHLRLRCKNEAGNSFLAYYSLTKNSINVSWDWALGSDIIARTATLVHEARHNKKPHLPVGEATCGKTISCDPNWGYNGANTFEALWLWSFSKGAVRTTTAHKDRAKQLAQNIIDTGFNDTPDITIY